MLIEVKNAYFNPSIKFIAHANIMSVWLEYGSEYSLEIMSFHILSHNPFKTTMLFMDSCTSQQLYQ